jgi:hypothetical protein
VIGTHKENVCKILLRENDPTHEKAIRICQVHEVSEKDVKEINPEKQKDVHVIRKKTQQYKFDSRNPH